MIRRSPRLSVPGTFTPSEHLSRLERLGRIDNMLWRCEHVAEVHALADVLREVGDESKTEADFANRELEMPEEPLWWFWAEWKEQL